MKSGKEAKNNRKRGMTESLERKSQTGSQQKSRWSRPVTSAGNFSFWYVFLLFAQKKKYNACEERRKVQ